ncbi:hypothetical protein SBFV3_gp05 [Sulfolobales Beppu filamentous virus 3]|uniref:Uncharacterized protein n=1 Tax=Sulfolobales Beppu filamentous virus 3 TaxID=2493124 RepID=A0A3S8NF31_9VIRU|nr:hypothetical protein HOU83_gp05 [Sulfolobales Beppu filamentous virus 3]AZI75840.1 hypothetical protein SBFV3_gp05 [Sulfolobales Beppu filamentous virus 3]
MLTNTKKWVYGGFDGHGSSTAVAHARDTNTPLERIIIKYPDTSPENLPKLLYSANHLNDEIEIIDIGINVKNPAEWNNIMQIVSANNTVTIYDHHETNLKLLQYLPNNVRLIQFSNTVEMAKALVSGEENFKIALIGTITDRDPTIKEILSPDSKEFETMYAIANAYDVIIRQNLVDAVKNVYAEGFAYLQRLPQTVAYPPASLARQVEVQKKDNVIIINALNVSLQQWIWKVLDYVMYINNTDYGVLIGKTLDRQLNTQIPVILVAKYWLSDVQDPLTVLKPIIGNRKTIGHPTAFSIAIVSEQEAISLANQIAETLSSQFSSVAVTVNAGAVSKAVQQDFNKILNMLAQILKTQSEMYKEYLELKRKQIELLEKTSDENRRRYD